jgi:hypothetical protein
MGPDLVRGMSVLGLTHQSCTAIVFLSEVDSFSKPLVQKFSWILELANRVVVEKD